MQLDLFNQPVRPSADIIAFPVWRRHAEPLWRSKVADTAATLAARKTPQGRSNAWARQLDWLAKRFNGMGMEHDSIVAELTRFRTAVTVELARRHHYERRGPGAA